MGSTSLFKEFVRRLNIGVSVSDVVLVRRNSEQYALQVRMSVNNASDTVYSISFRFVKSDAVLADVVYGAAMACLTMSRNMKYPFAE